MQTKSQKKQILEGLNEKLAKQKAMVLVDFTGLRVKDFSNLRKKIKASGDEIKVAKKTLSQLAFKKAGIDIEMKKIPGEIAFVFGYKDEVSPAKTVYQFSRENKNIKIMGGFLENKFKGIDEIIMLAQLPSKDELLAKMVGSMQAPVSNFVYALKYNLKGLVLALNAIKDNK